MITRDSGFLERRDSRALHGTFESKTIVGKQIMKVAAERMKRVSFELGGKSSVYIFDDADLEQAIPAAAMGIFRNSGQVCVAG